MKEMDRMRLDFSTDREHRPALLRTELRVAGAPPLIAHAVPMNSGPGFVWDLHRGLPRVLALMLVRVARWRYHDWPPQSTTLPLAGGSPRPCAASRCGDLKALTTSAWLAEILSPTLDKLDAHRRLARWFSTPHVHGRPGDPFPRVELQLEHLTPDRVEVWLDGNPAAPARLDWIETRLADAIDGSLPPLPAGPRHRLAGFLPSVGPDFWDRDGELSALTAHYADSACRLVEIVAGGGGGKTALARAWVRQRFGDESLRHPLVFSWSFYRQGYSHQGRHSLWPFYRSLATALGLEVAEGMLPRKLVSELLGGLGRTPTLLLLDGLEVLIGGRRVEGTPEVGRSAAGARPAITDTAMALLLEALAAGDHDCFTLVTSRESVVACLRGSSGRARQLSLAPLPTPLAIRELLETLEPASAGAPDEPGAEAVTLALRIGFASAPASRQPAVEPGRLDIPDPSSASPSAPMAGIAAPALPREFVRVVRRGLEALGNSPEYCLIALASLFDRPAEWEGILAAIRSPAGAGRFTRPWRDLPDEQWDEAREHLQELGWIQPSGDGLLHLHPLVQRCVAEDLRRAMPEARADGHRRLYEYFAGLPRQYLPETLEEMEPLFRACWHGCQAGDFQRTFREVAYARISRYHEAFIVLTIGAYEETISLVGLFSEDGESFPGSDLDNDEKIQIAHARAVCLRYLDRLDEAFEVESAAWRRAQNGVPGSVLGPIALNLLRLYHIFGRLRESGAALRSLLRGLLTSDKPTVFEGVSEEFVPNAAAYVFAVVAHTLVCRGNPATARAILAFAAQTARRSGKSGKHLLPPLGAPFHALALLELGDWKTVAAGLAAGDLDTPYRRNRDTGVIDYIRGRVLAASARTLSERRAALGPFHDCLRQAETNGLKWCRAAALLEIGKLHLELGEIALGRGHIEEVFAVASTHGFGLLKIDARLALAGQLQRDRELRAAGDHLMLAEREIEACGYGLRRGELRRLRRLAGVKVSQAVFTKRIPAAGTGEETKV